MYHGVSFVQKLRSIIVPRFCVISNLYNFKFRSINIQFAFIIPNLNNQFVDTKNAFPSQCLKTSPGWVISDLGDLYVIQLFEIANLPYYLLACVYILHI